MLLVAPPAGAQDERPRHVDVVQVSGWIDPVVADFVANAVESSEESRAEALVIQLDSPGSLLDDDELDALVDRVRQADVPVAMWVGGSGAKALGGAARLVLAAPVVGMAPKARLEVDGDRLSPREALDRELVQLNQSESAVLGTFIAALDGDEVAGTRLETADFEEQADGPPQATLNVQARLAKLDLGPRMMHTAASPPVAYLLLLTGLALLLFELFTGGIGIAGGVGAVALVLSAYGLTVLPTSPVGLALLVLGMFGFAVDVQTGVPRFWTAIGVVGLVVGSLLLYDEPVQLGWLPLVGGVIGVVLLMLAGLPATVRSRFSTPTIGRESMVGEEGVVVADLAPEGVVRVREALWPARINRATPVATGGSVRVVGIDGARLEVAVDVPDGGGGSRSRRT